MNRTMIVAGGFALALVLGACGNNDDNPETKAKAGQAAGKASTPSTPSTPSNQSTPPTPTSTVSVAEGRDGQILTDTEGRTLYRFDKDTNGVSNCSGTCAQTWPPFVLDNGATPTAGPGVDVDLGIFDRADGARQITGSGSPLYYYAGDSVPGDTNGNGIGGVWHLVADDAASTTPVPASSGYSSY